MCCLCLAKRGEGGVHKEHSYTLQYTIVVTALLDCTFLLHPGAERDQGAYVENSAIEIVPET